MLKTFYYDEAKNTRLLTERGLSFPQIIQCIENGGIVDIILNPQQEKYPNQTIYVIDIGDYLCAVPFDENETTVFLRTIYKSRKINRHYKNKESPR